MKHHSFLHPASTTAVDEGATEGTSSIWRGGQVPQVFPFVAQHSCGGAMTTARQCCHQQAMDACIFQSQSRAMALLAGL